MLPLYNIILNKFTDILHTTINYTLSTTLQSTLYIKLHTFYDRVYTYIIRVPSKYIMQYIFG